MDNKNDIYSRQDALPPGTLLHGHKILSVINAGAFGIAYKVLHLETNQLRVIKEYMPDSGAVRDRDSCSVVPKSTQDRKLFDWGLEAFINEAKLLMKQNHPNIVPVLEAFRKFGTAYFVMPFIDGVTLTKWIEGHPNPTQQDIEHIFLPILEGLKHIHQQNILHRDIKPDNVIISTRGTPILIDFGAARQTTASKSQVLTKVLTPHFAAFEQYSSTGPFTPALDLYAVAASIYFAITRTLPVEAPDRVQGDDYVALTSMQLNQSYSSGMLKAVDRCLSLFAKDRYQTGMEFQLALYGQEAEPETNDHSEGGTLDIRQRNMDKLTELIFAMDLNGELSLEQQGKISNTAEKLGLSAEDTEEVVNLVLKVNGESEPSYDDLDSNPEKLKEAYRVKGGSRLFFHLGGIVNVLMSLLLSFYFIASPFVSDIREGISIMLSAPYETASISYWVYSTMGTNIIEIFALVIMPFWLAWLYIRIVRLKRSKLSYGELHTKIKKICGSVQSYIGSSVLVLVLMFDVESFGISLLTLLITFSVLKYTFRSFLNEEMNKELGIEKND